MAPSSFMRRFRRAFLTVCVVSGTLTLASCESQQDRDARELSASQTNLAEATARVDEAKRKVAEVDDGLAWLIQKNNEDPAKANLLLSECRAETGAQMEGEGALILTRCIRSRW